MPWDFWLIFVVLGMVLPWRGYQRMRALMALPQVTGRDRVTLYLATIGFQWLLTLVIAWRALARGLSLRDLGVRFPAGVSSIAITLFGATLIAAAHWANVRRVSRADHAAARRLRDIGSRIFPRTKEETALFVLLAMTAGLCEEFLFRGFVLGALERIGLAAWLAVLLSSAMFGLAHLYQGRGGSLGTALVGTIFAVVRIAYHSLLPSVVWHAVLDIVAGIAGAKFLFSDQPTETKVLEEIHR